ncbi:MAG: hypothetical protein ACM3KM_03515 [Acidobacteriaceae bacterium]
MPKFEHLNRKTNLGRQNGVTLLLAVLILSTISLVTLSVSYFAIVEMRASRGNTLTEPAIGAAETAGEQAIWSIKRSSVGGLPPDCATSTYYTSLSGDVTGTRTLQKKCSTFGPVRFDLVPKQSIDIYLYDPNDINGNKTMLNSSGVQLFSAFGVSMTGSYAVSVSAVTMDGINVTGTQFNPVVSVNNAVPLVQSIPNPVPGSVDQRIRITITAPENGYASVIVSATSPAGINGLPGFPTIDTEGCSANSNISNCNSAGDIFKRRLNITVPL